MSEQHEAAEQPEIAEPYQNDNTTVNELEPQPDPEPEILAYVAPPPTNKEILDNIKEQNIPVLTIGNTEIPLRAGNMSQYVWALFNLILSIASLTIGLIALMKTFVAKLNNRIDLTYDPEEENQEKYKKIFLAFVPLTSLIAMLLLIITEKMSNLMVLIDRWTIPHVILIMLGLAFYYITFKRKPIETENDELSLEAKILMNF